jgi:RNase P subunit RPR2
VIVIEDVEVVAPGMAQILVSGSRSRRLHTLWAQTKLRKRTTCVGCQRPLAPGDEAYRTMHDTDYRMHRLCTGCIERLGRKEPTDA